MVARIHGRLPPEDLGVGLFAAAPPVASGDDSLVPKPPEGSDGAGADGMDRPSKSSKALLIGLAWLDIMPVVVDVEGAGAADVIVEV